MPKFYISDPSSLRCSPSGLTKVPAGGVLIADAEKDKNGIKSGLFKGFRIKKQQYFPYKKPKTD